MFKTKKSRWIATGVGALLIVGLVLQFTVVVVPTANRARHGGLVEQYTANPQSAEIALEKNPDDAAANEGLAQAYMAGKGGKTRDPIEAIKYFRETVRIEPDNSGAWLLLGSLLKRSGQTDEAIQIMQKLANDKDYGQSARKNLARWQVEPAA